MKPGSGLALSLVALGAAVAASGPAPAARPVPVRFPDTDIGVDSLAARAKAQRETVDQFKVFYEFQFKDRVEVDWPSGRKQVLTEGIQANATLRVTEPR